MNWHELDQRRERWEKQEQARIDAEDRKRRQEELAAKRLPMAAGDAVERGFDYGLGVLAMVLLIGLLKFV